MIPQHRSTPRVGEREETARDRDREREMETAKTEKSRRAREGDREKRKKEKGNQADTQGETARSQRWGETRDGTVTEGEMGRDKHRGQD